MDASGNVSSIPAHCLCLRCASFELETMPFRFQHPLGRTDRSCRRNLRSAANDRAGNHAIQFGTIERTNGIASQQRIRTDNKLTVGIYHYQISPFAGDDSTTASGFQCICGWGFSRTLAVR